MGIESLQVIHVGDSKPEPVALRFISDDGHGWLAVPLAMLDAVGVASQISRYSYQGNATAFLEEDCDYSVFVAACRDRGIPLAIVEERVDGLSSVRNMPHYVPPHAPVTLTSGRTFTHRHIGNGAQEAVAPPGTPDEMTPAEWDEYCALRRAANKPR